MKDKQLENDLPKNQTNDLRGHDDQGQKDKFSALFFFFHSILFGAPEARGEERDTLSEMIGRENPII